MTDQHGAADEVLRHSEDEGEWDEQAEQIEVRPSGTQVISARLPAGLAEQLLAEARRRGVKASELVRQAVEAFMSVPANGVFGLSANTQGTVRLSGGMTQLQTENLNLVVNIPTEPPEIVAIGLLC